MSGVRHEARTVLTLCRTRVSITDVITKATMHTLKLTQIGNSVGAIFPKELLARLQLEKGDEL